MHLSQGFQPQLEKTPLPPLPLGDPHCQGMAQRLRRSGGDGRSAPGLPHTHKERCWLPEPVEAIQCNGGAVGACMAMVKVPLPQYSH